MGRRVFLDIGAHHGETLEEVVKRRWRFDRIWCFEPASPCLPALRRFADDRVEVVPAGLGPRDETVALHDPGSIGASIHAGKAGGAGVEMVRILDAAAWMGDHIEAGDAVWVKVNCEGAECDLLDHLLATGEVGRIDHLLVHFDVEKIPGMAHRAAETRRRLDAAGVPWIEARKILSGRSHARKTANWLAWTEAGWLGRLRYRYLARWEFRARQMLYPLKARLRKEAAHH